MSPELLYWIALAVCVVPSLPFNRVAIVVAAVWWFGHFAHWLGPYEDAAYMAARIVAFGAALGLSKPWDRSGPCITNVCTAILFLPAAALSFYVASYSNHPPQTWEEYHWQTAIYWSTWAIIMVQAMLVPFGNDWSKARNALNKIDAWVMGKVVRHFGDAL